MRFLQLLLLFPVLLSAQQAKPEPAPFVKPDVSQMRLPPTAVAKKAALAHTAQFFPTNLRADVTAQTKSVLQQADAVLQSVQSGLNRAVKLNLYVASKDLAAEVGKVVADHFAGSAQFPALAWVQTELPGAKAKVALDVVAISNAKTLIRNPQVAVIPAGRHLYISGQAENTISLQACSQLTMQSLIKTLRDCKLGIKDVVQIKAFLTPMTNLEDLKREVERHFPADSLPPIVYVEWVSKNLPAEIELIAYAGPYEAGLPPIEYITPPGMKSSKVFSRVTRVNGEDLIYLSGLFGAPDTGAADQIHLIFAQMEVMLASAGSDMKHLAKATYYVTTDDASELLTDIRLEYFDPKRPPAASKATVKGTGVTGCTITMDMIAVGKGS